MQYFKALLTRKMGLRLPSTFRAAYSPTDVALHPKSYTKVTFITVAIQRFFFLSFSENELDFQSKLELPTRRDLIFS